MTPEIEKKQIKRLFENARDFLNGGLDLLMAKSVTSRQCKLSAVAIQTSIELFSKYRLAQSHGLQSVIVTKLDADIDETVFLDGNFRTIPYSRCLEKIRSEEGFSEIEDELIERVQQLRNKLAHFAAEIDISETRNDLTWVLIRALAMFAAGADRDQGEFQDHRRFLDGHNFMALTAFKPYRDEAIDSADDSLDSEKVVRCWECLNDTLSLRASDTYFCHCCGFTVDSYAVVFADCDECKSRDGIFYDPHNKTNGLFLGRCLFCDEDMALLECEECGTISSAVRGSKSLVCKECS